MIVLNVVWAQLGHFVDVCPIIVSHKRWNDFKYVYADMVLLNKMYEIGNKSIW